MKRPCPTAAATCKPTKVRKLHPSKAAPQQQDHNSSKTISKARVTFIRRNGKVHRIRTKKFTAQKHTRRECHLLTLPAELRHQIYEYLVIKDHRLDFSTTRPPALALANRQLFREVMPLFFSENVFVFDVKLVFHVDPPRPPPPVAPQAVLPSAQPPGQVITTAYSVHAVNQIAATTAQLAPPVWQVQSQSAQPFANYANYQHWAQVQSGAVPAPSNQAQVQVHAQTPAQIQSQAQTQTPLRTLITQGSVAQAQPQTPTHPQGQFWQTVLQPPGQAAPRPLLSLQIPQQPPPPATYPIIQPPPPPPPPPANPTTNQPFNSCPSMPPPPIPRCLTKRPSPTKLIYPLSKTSPLPRLARLNPTTPFHHLAFSLQQFSRAANATVSLEVRGRRAERTVEVTFHGHLASSPPGALRRRRYRFGRGWEQALERARSALREAATSMEAREGFEGFTLGDVDVLAGCFDVGKVELEGS